MSTMHDTLSKLKNEATEFARNFNMLTNAHMGIHDMRYDLAIPSGLMKNNLCRYCNSKCHEFHNKCKCDDKKYLDKAALTKQTTIFRCHLGATSVIIPIVENNLTVGVIDFGMIFVQPDDSLSFDSLYLRLTKEYPDVFTEDSRTEMLEAYKNTCVMSEEQLQCYISIIRYAAQGMYLNTLFSANYETPSSRLRRYIRFLHPERIPLSSFSVADIAQNLNFSKSHLTRLAEEEFGMPLKQYILNKKIEYAKELLLKEPFLYIHDIAEQVGIDDPHYLSRIFRRKTGYTCQEYRTVMINKAKEQNIR